MTILEKLRADDNGLIESMQIDLQNALGNGDERERAAALINLLGEIRRSETPASLIDLCIETLYLKTREYQAGLRLFNLHLDGHTIPTEEPLSLLENAIRHASERNATAAS